MKLSKTTIAQPERDYWKKIADQEFESMDQDAKNQWEELRRITK